MGVPTADTMVTYVRYHLQDTDTTDQALTDAQVYIELNDAYHDFLAAFPDLLIASVGTITTVNGTNTYTLDATDDFRDLTICTNSTTGPIERGNIEEVLDLIGTLSGTNIRSWAVQRSDTDHTIWTVYVVPTPTTAKTYTFYGHKEPADLSTGLTPMVGTAEARWIARIAAARAAVKLGRTQQYIEGLWRDLPAQVQNEMRVVEGAKRPFVNQNEIVT